jgi:large subunit ribosomal protein L25
MMSESLLIAEAREGKGKSIARRIRRAGRVPAVIYGEVKQPLNIAVDAHDLEMKLREKVSLFNISLDGKEHPVIVRDIQYHPVKSNVLHIDFLQVKKGHKITMTVPIKLEGKPEGVKAGGILEELKREVTIEVLPKDIPDSIIVDISGLQMGDGVHVRDLLAENFEIQDDLDDFVCRVEMPRTAEETEEEMEEEEEMAEPEVITSKEKEESES